MTSFFKAFDKVTARVGEALLVNQKDVVDRWISKFESLGHDALREQCDKALKGDIPPEIRMPQKPTKLTY
jgi:hypothetical protein